MLSVEVGIMIKAIITLLTMYGAAIWAITNFIGANGLNGEFFESNTALKVIIYIVAMSHLTITMMSLSFHRYHTHKGVILNKYLDTFMALWLWLVTSMSKLDWVSVHIYHHAHSDKEKDPHSPVQKGFWRVFTLGVFDYTRAKAQDDVVKIRKTLKRNKFEQFISENLLLGPILLSSFNLIMFGPFWGSILSVINFSISPLFAVGGVNAVAHMWGYKNHAFSDNSRNIGFLFPLNFIICGELDHNNHHAHQRSCSFRHRWFEFDIGYVYLKLLSKLGLAEIKNAYTTKTLKMELSQKARQLLEKDLRFKKKMEELAAELNTSYSELVAKVEAYIAGRKVDFQGHKMEFDKRLKELARELKRTVQINAKLKLTYA